MVATLFIFASFLFFLIPFFFKELEKHFKLHSCPFLRGCIVYISTEFPLLVIYDQLESQEWGKAKV